MKKTLAIVAACLVLLGGAGYLAAPRIARHVAESEVDSALKRLRRQTTSVVNRGEITVDLSNFSVKVRDITIEGAGREQRTRVGSLTVVRPSHENERLTARQVVFEDVTVSSAGETVSIPRIVIDGYSGPERGLTATPGIGRNARTQADLISQVSIDRAVAPLVTFTGEQTRVRRVVRNVVVDGVTSGVIKAVTADRIEIDAPYLPPETSEDAASVKVRTGRVSYEGFSLPTLWRFYAGDGAGDRESFLKKAAIADVSAIATARTGGVVTAAWNRLTLSDIKIRPLAFPVTTFDPIASKFILGAESTPADFRAQLLLGSDALHAIAFDRISITGGTLDIAVKGSPHLNAKVANAEIGPYADGGIEAIRVDRFAFEQQGGPRLAVEEADVSKFDARAMLDHADKVGRDEVLLTTAPTAEELVRITPRIAAIGAKGVEATSSDGEVKLAGARIDINAPVAAVPQKVAFKLDGLDAKPAAGSRFKTMLDKIEIDALRGGLGFAVTLDPGKRTLSLDRFDYSFEQLATISAKGEFSSIDPALAIATGAEFVDKFSAIELGVFRFNVKDDGAVAILLRRAADAAKSPPEVYRETIARDAQAQIFRLFGPPAENSAESAAEFIRDPRTVEITLSPRTVGAPLLDLIRAFDLGPAGLAQVVDLSVLYRR